jgi:hypothetical protein
VLNTSTKTGFGIQKLLIFYSQVSDLWRLGQENQNEISSVLQVCAEDARIHGESNSGNLEMVRLLRKKGGCQFLAFFNKWF